jgi:hypothetical protein
VSKELAKLVLQADARRMWWRPNRNGKYKTHPVLARLRSPVSTHSTVTRTMI